MKYIVTWISGDKKQTDYTPFETRKEAKEFYDQLVGNGCYSASICKIVESTDY